jgi:hypothetical protein
MCFTLGASIAEIVSAFPTCGGLYSASALLCPKNQRARVRVIIIKQVLILPRLVPIPHLDSPFPTSSFPQRTQMYVNNDKVANTVGRKNRSATS